MLQFLEINLLTICNLGTKSCIKCIKSGPPFIPHQSLGHTPPASYKFPHFAIKNFEFAFKPFSLGDFQNAHCCLISLNVIFFSLQSLISIFKSYTYHQIHRNCPQRRIPILWLYVNEFQRRIPFWGLYVDELQRQTPFLGLYVDELQRQTLIQLMESRRRPPFG